MTGYIRFILAILVLLSHTGVTINGLNPGVVAVIIFYMLAGGVVTHLWQDILPQGKGKLFSFYKDRILRIFPLYIYIATLTLIFITITNYGSPQFSPLAIINNLLIIPLNYYMVIDSTILTEPSWWLIPQSWSLGTELQAYLLLPFVLMYKKLRQAVFLISIIIYTLANINIIHTDYFGYRLLPGVFFIFILGGMIKQTQRSPIKTTSPNLLFLILLIMYGLFDYFNAFTHVYTQETLIGLLIGIPLLTLAGKTSLKLPFNTLAASLSYGIFLAHFLIIWALDYSELLAAGTMLYYSAVVMLSMLIAYSGVVLIETRVDIIRMRPKAKNT